MFLSPFTPRFSTLLAVTLLLATSKTGAADPTDLQLPPVLLQMIRDSSIHEELRLSEAQRDQVLESLKSVDGRWFRSRNLAADTQRQEIDALTAEITPQLAAILDTTQSRHVCANSNVRHWAREWYCEVTSPSPSD